MHCLLSSALRIRNLGRRSIIRVQTRRRLTENQLSILKITKKDAANVQTGRK